MRSPCTAPKSSPFSPQLKKACAAVKTQHCPKEKLMVQSDALILYKHTENLSNLLRSYRKLDACQRLPANCLCLSLNSILTPHTLIPIYIKSAGKFRMSVGKANQWALVAQPQGNLESFPATLRTHITTWQKQTEGPSPFFSWSLSPSSAGAKP